MGPKIVGQEIELSRAGISGGMHEAHAVEATAALLSFKDHKNGCQQAATEPTEDTLEVGSRVALIHKLAPGSGMDETNVIPHARMQELRRQGQFPSGNTKYVNRAA